MSIQEREARRQARVQAIQQYKAAGGKKLFARKRYRYRRNPRGARYDRQSPRTYGGRGGRPLNIIQGMGAYRAPRTAAVAKQLGQGIGSLLPGFGKLASPFLGEAAGWLGDKIGTWLGLGSYQLSQNSLVLDEGSSPAMMHGGDDTIMVRHREFISDVYSSEVAGQFKVQHFPLQPGLGGVFEWLAPIAHQYQEWIPLGIVFEFKSHSGDVVTGASSSLGQVIMATDYNAYNTLAFQNKTQMQNTVYTTSARVTESFYHPIECAPHRNVMDRLFVRGDDVPQGQPPQLYDLGTFAIASQGVNGASQNLGELWVTYEIGFSKASLLQTVGRALSTDVYYTASPGIAFGPMTEDFVKIQNSSAGTSLSVPTSGPSLGHTIISFPPQVEQGWFKLDYYGANVSPGVLVAENVFGLFNCELINFFNKTSGISGNDQYQIASGNYVSEIPPGPDATLMCSVIVKINNQGARLDWRINNIPGGNDYKAWLFVTQLNYTLIPPA